jgi:hypothetical protein
MAITAPILIFMMIGVFEIGWGLRGYIILTNINREITRFAVRPGYLDFSTKADVITSYNRIYDWVETANSGELPLNFAADSTGNVSLIVSHVVIDTGFPFDVSNSAYDNPATEWNCNVLDPTHASYNPSVIFTDDDLIIHPGISTYAYQAMTFPDPISATRAIPASRIDYASLVSQTLIPQNNKFNCEIIKKGGVASANNVMITQMFFNQEHLFGFPFISNTVTDPVPMYAHTSMRLSTAARSSGSQSGSIVDNISTTGPVCAAMPIIIEEDQLVGAQPDVTQLDILDGNEGGDWGWLVWNPAEDDENYLQRELKYPQLSLNDFTNTALTSDHTLNVGDHVKSYNGLADSSDIRTALQDLVGETIIVPVWNGTTGFVTDNIPSLHPSDVKSYVITRFIKVRINVDGIKLTPDKAIMATYVGPADDACQ